MKVVMHSSDTPYIIIGGIALLITISGVLGVLIANFRNKNKDQTDSNMGKALAGSQALISVYEKRELQHEEEKKEWNNKFAEQSKEVGELRGELKTLRDVPLKGIATTLEILAENQVVLGTALAEVLQLKDLDKKLKRPAKVTT